jgi:NAD+ synthase
MSKKYEHIKAHLLKFLEYEVKKTGLTSTVVGLSGGIDSAVVAVLANEVFGKDLHCVMMPSHYSSDNSLDDAQELVDKFNLNAKTVSIAPLVQAYEESMKGSNLRIGNFSARMRMAILFDESAAQGALVLGTSNKSELLLGYGTIFGDLASAINPIGDLYKTEVFEFASYLGVVDSIISKPPSADLFEGQSDEADLGYTYAQLDAVLRDLVDRRIAQEDLLQIHNDEALVKKVVSRVYANQFKRKMPLIAKISERTIGHDFLYPRDVKI